VLITVLGLFLLFIALIICLTAVLDALQRYKPLGTVTNPMARIIGSSMGCFMLLGIVFTAVGSVSREREQHTLESLLTLPIEREDILWAKWLGSILSVRRLGYGLAGLWMVCFIAGGLHIFAVALLGLAFAAHAAFAASLGLFFSVTSPSKMQATLRALIVLFAIMVASVLAGEQTAYSTPMMSFWMLAFGPQDRFISFHPRHDYTDFETEPAALVMALIGTVAYALMAVILWSWACARFRGEKG
jgi:ABC-type transport system involved in multi-copper enzyme maturation permease subunit